MQIELNILNSNFTGIWLIMEQTKTIALRSEIRIENDFAVEITSHVMI
jgi:hypothetical protein